MTGLQIRLLGRFDLVLDGEPRRFTLSARGIALLGYAVTHAGEPISRASLAALLWPDDDEEDARGKLRRRLHELRAALPPSHRSLLEATAKTVRYEPRDVWVDVAEFERAIDAGRLLEAVGIYRGEFLEGQYDEWIMAERERLRARFLGVCYDAALAARRDRDFETALACAARMLEVDEWREDALRLTMTLHYEAGDRAAALAAYERFAARLRAEMGVDPMPETRALRGAVMENARLQADVVRTPLVGRSGELDTLGLAWVRAARGSGTTVFVGGVAGIGKSRLVGELAASLAAQGGRTLFGGTSNPEAAPYESIADALRRSSALILESGIEDVWLAALAPLLPELREARPSLPAVEPLAPDRARTRLFEAIARVVDHVARTRPVLLVLEDLHWAQAATLDAVEALARRIGALPVLLVATYRSDEATAEHGLSALRRRLQSERRASSMVLRPLESGDVAEMIARTPAYAPVADAIASSVYALCEGKPLFASQLLQMYAESGRLPDEREAARGVSQTILARVNALDEDARSLAETAAAIGRTFKIETAAAVLEWSDGRVFDALGTLLDRSIVREARGAAFEYAFAHALIAASIADSTPEPARRPLHRKIAGSFEAGGSRDLQTLSAIARHWKLGGEAERAGAAYAAAAQAALDVYARAEAMEWAREALALGGDRAQRAALLLLLSRAQDRHGDVASWARDLDELELVASGLGDDERFAVQEQRERYYGQTGDRERQRAAIAKMLSIAESTASPAQRAAAFCALGLFEFVCGNLSLAVAALREVSSLGARAPESTMAMARDYLVRALVRLGRDEEAEREISAQRREVRERPSLLARRLLANAEATLAVERENAELAATSGADLLEIARETGDFELEAKAQNIMGFGAMARMDARAVAQHFTTSVAIMERLGSLSGTAMALCNHGVFESWMGRSREAIALFERAMELCEQAQAKSVSTYSRVNLAADYLNVGDLRRALEHAARAAADAAEIGDRRLLASAMMAHGDILTRSGEVERGIELMTRALNVRRETGITYSLADDLCTFVDTLMDVGKKDDALAMLPELKHFYETSLEHVKIPTFVCWAYARLLDAAGEGKAAAAIVERGVATIERDRERIGDAAIAAAYAARPFNRGLLEWKGRPRRRARSRAERT